MLSQAQKFQMKRLKGLYKKYDKQGTIIDWSDQLIVFRNGKKANCVSIDEQILAKFKPLHTLRLSSPHS
jgi:hypothetical protein